MNNKDKNIKIFSHIFVLMLCAIIAISATFSWYSRQSAQSLSSGNELTYSQSGHISGNGCNVTTYVGENDNGKISYSATDISSGTTSLTAAPGKFIYFKTEIQDNSTALKSNISVYLENFSYTSPTNTAIKIGLTQPEKTYKSFTTTTDGSAYKISSIQIEDNLQVAKGSTTIVYWFIEFADNATTGTSATLGNIHIVYN